MSRRRTTTGGKKPRFLYNLHRIVADAPDEVAAWDICGTQVNVFDPTRLEQVITEYFNCTLTSFIRQLNMYQFTRQHMSPADACFPFPSPSPSSSSSSSRSTSNSSSRARPSSDKTRPTKVNRPWYFYHEYFLRDRPELLYHIKAQRTKRLERRAREGGRSTRKENGSRTTSPPIRRRSESGKGGGSSSSSSIRGKFRGNSKATTATTTSELSTSAAIHRNKSRQGGGRAEESEQSEESGGSKHYEEQGTEDEDEDERGRAVRRSLGTTRQRYIPPQVESDKDLAPPSSSLSPLYSFSSNPKPESERKVKRKRLSSIRDQVQHIERQVSVLRKDLDVILRSQNGSDSESSEQSQEEDDEEKGKKRKRKRKIARSKPKAKSKSQSNVATMMHPSSFTRIQGEEEEEEEEEEPKHSSAEDPEYQSARALSTLANTAVTQSNLV